MAANLRDQIPLQAILLVDCFTDKFSPITLECPKVLLPLVNVPMIDYTLDWLESSGVQQVLVPCVDSVSEMRIRDFLYRFGWFSKPNFDVFVGTDPYLQSGESHPIHIRDMIHGDFILVSGDVVSNMSLTKAMQEHNDRRAKDPYAIMTMVINQSAPDIITHQSRLGTDELYMAINNRTKQLLYYNERANYPKGTKCLDAELRAKYKSLHLYNHKQDCYVDICSPEVLSNLPRISHYLWLRRAFIQSLLEDRGQKIFTHEIRSCYATRVDNFRSYDTISKYIINRWRGLEEEKDRVVGKCACKLKKQEMYRASEEIVSDFPYMGFFNVIGSGTSIGKNTKVSNSVIGKGTCIGNNTEVLDSVIGEECVIGSDLKIEDCYIWNYVTVEDGCKLSRAVICDGVILKSGVVLKPGVVLSFNVIVGQNFEVPAYSKVSSLRPPIKRDSDEQNCAFTATENELSRDFASLLPRPPSHTASEVGAGGGGYIWPIEGASYWMHSVAPIPVGKLCEILQSPGCDFVCAYKDVSKDIEYIKIKELSSA